MSSKDKRNSKKKDIGAQPLKNVTKGKDQGNLFSLHYISTCKRKFYFQLKNHMHQKN